MALPHPDSPELQRFSFFISRRLEDNRERFRLHMGYFSTLAEAEEWLAVVREFYPGAWAGEAPGKKLRARAAAQAAAGHAAAARLQAPAPPRRARPVATPAPARATSPAAAPGARVTRTSAPRPVPARLAAALSTPARAPSSRVAPPPTVPTVHAAPSSHVM